MSIWLLFFRYGVFSLFFELFRLRTEASAAVHVPRPNVLTPAEREEAELAEMKKVREKGTLIH